MDTTVYMGLFTKASSDSLFSSLKHFKRNQILQIKNRMSLHDSQLGALSIKKKGSLRGF